MDAYVYRAALLCDECGKATRKALADRAPVDQDDESSYDSDDYPKGPYANGGGEADTPQHCDMCNVFLENPLTDYGRRYVLNSYNDCPSQTTALWVSFYGLEELDSAE
jgi:hypothetical protein